MKAISFVTAAIAVGFVACPAPNQLGTASGQLVVFHTPTAVKTAVMTPAEQEHLRTRVRGFYPAACIDDDSDGDSIPDSLDDAPVTVAAKHGADDGTVDDSDGGVSGGGTDDAADHDPNDDSTTGVDDDNDEHSAARGHCKQCNRGPGVAGEFRLDVDGARLRLQRGRVLAHEGNVVTLNTPDGLLRIVISATTELKGGEPAPGADIRAEGLRDAAATDLTLLADKLEVLCPAPPSIPDAQVPPEAQPIPGTTTTPPPTDGGTVGETGGTFAN